ncbi:MAG: 4Fe-4S binding protein [Anaerolineaceae bacterium]|jgi:formate hydrogenlyase subunit 6/NADH:ubiquinone oxidoreductase subunit I
MTIGSMLGDIVNSFFRKPVTEKYPFVRSETPDDLRGKVVWNPETCTGCGLCVKDCPSDALELFTLDRAAKRYVMLYHMDACTFCSQCEVSCRSKSITLSNDQWELASTSRTPFDIYYGREEDVAKVLETASQEKTEPDPEGCE